MLVVLAAVVISTRGDRWKRASLVLAFVETSLIAVGAVAGALAVLERKFVGPGTATDLYSDAEKVGEISVYAGILLAAAAVGYLALRQLRGGRDQASA